VNESVTAELDQLQVLVLFGWCDGPTEGVARHRGSNACWYFKLFAERRETDTPDGRLFAFWAIPDSACSILGDEFGNGDPRGVVRPMTGGLGSAEAQSIVEELFAARRGPPNLIIWTVDFVDVLGVWNVVPDREL
jgi:hypothetical protein